MPPIAFLALLTITLLALAALKLELNFRRTAEAEPGALPARGEAGLPSRRPEPSAGPELRAPPAGGYWQAPFPSAH